MTEFAKMYGGSLYDLAAEERADSEILAQLDECVGLLRDNPDYLRLLSTPSLPKKERCGLLDEALRGEIHIYLLNFLKILCERGQLRQLAECARAYRLQYNAAHGILEATAVSAVALTSDQAGGSRRSWRRSPASRSTCTARSTPACWAVFGWTSTAPSWTARSRTGCPACAAALRPSPCKDHPP